MKRIAILEPGYRDYEEEKRVLAEFSPEITVVKAGAGLEEAKKAVAGADAIMVREAPVGAELLKAARGCAVVVRYGVGVDNIDLEAARALGIKVANVPDYGSDDVAEHALALMLAATRRVATRDRDVRAGRWNIGQDEPMPRITGKNLGVLGYGRIAKRFIAKASGLGFERIYVTDPVLEDEEAKKAGVAKAPLEELLSKSDFISVHVPLNKSTRHMIGRAQIALMRPNAVVVNAGRGGIIDEQALAEALAEGRIFAAGIDTFEQEPPKKDNPLLRLSNTVLSDHTAWYTSESVIELQHKAAMEVLRAFRGEELLHQVNK